MYLRSLAYFTIRSILARMLWHFDMELCDESKGWHNQGSFILWDKPRLWIKLLRRSDLERKE
jgi:hypothetical protein